MLIHKIYTDISFVLQGNLNHNFEKTIFLKKMYLAKQRVNKQFWGGFKLVYIF